MTAPAAASPLRDFYENPAVPASSGPDRAYRQAEMLAGLLASMPAPARILDVGCGDGFATSVAARRNSAHHFVGLDWSVPSLTQAAARGLTVLRAGLDAPLPVRSASVDVVIMSEVIEHLVDTDSAVEEAHRVLRPGGSLLLSTPNLAAWYNRGLLALGIQPVFSEVSLRSVFGRPGSQVAGPPAHVHPPRPGRVPRRLRPGVRAGRRRALPRCARRAPPARPDLLPLAVRGLDPARAGTQGVMLHRLALRARPQARPAAAAPGRGREPGQAAHLAGPDRPGARAPCPWPGAGQRIRPVLRHGLRPRAAGRLRGPRPGRRSASGGPQRPRRRPGGQDHPGRIRSENNLDRDLRAGLLRCGGTARGQVAGARRRRQAAAARPAGRRGLLRVEPVRRRAADHGAVGDAARLRRAAVGRARGLRPGGPHPPPVAGRGHGAGRDRRFRGHVGHRARGRARRDLRRPALAGAGPAGSCSRSASSRSPACPG